MKSKILLILSSFICMNGFAQQAGSVPADQIEQPNVKPKSVQIPGLVVSKEPEHLEPVEWNISMRDYQLEYHANIRSILFKGLPVSPVIRYLVTPSFETEYVMQIESDYATKKNYVNVRRAKQSIWYTKDKSTIEVEKWRNNISQEDVDLIKQLYINAIMKTQYVKNQLSGLDGTSYYFSVQDGRTISGRTWSPIAGTKMGKLVEISELILEEVKAANFTGLTDALKKQIKNLTDLLA